MSRRTKIIWICVCIAVMIICIALGARFRNEYVSLGGVIFCFVGLTALGITVKVRAMREIKRALKELGEEDPDNPSTVGELVQMCFGFTKEAKRKLKAAPTGDKLKVIALFVSLGVLLAIMAAGIVCANIGTLSNGTITKTATIGFILMGIGGGGFFVEIILLAIISHFKNR